MTYQPTNSIFFSHKTSQRYFQSWLISKISLNEQSDGVAEHFSWVLLYLYQTAAWPTQGPLAAAAHKVIIIEACGQGA